MPDQPASIVAELSPLKRLALSYAPAPARAPTLALLALDERLAAVLRGRGEPLTAQLRLAWWSDVLSRPVADWPQGEPVLDALRGWRYPSALAALPSVWEALLADDLSPPVIAEFADGRGRAFAALARELGVAAVDDAAAAARVWALADLAANLSDGAERERVVGCGRGLGAPARLPASLRPLAVLAGLGAAALARGGGALLAGPASAFHALRIGLTGR